MTERNDYACGRSARARDNFYAERTAELNREYEKQKREWKKYGPINLDEIVSSIAALIVGYFFYGVTDNLITMMIAMILTGALSFTKVGAKIIRVFLTICAIWFIFEVVRH